MTLLAEASDPTTRPERLRELAASTKEIRLAVAGNPNASAETLLLLGVSLPAEVLNNPVFELLLFDDSNLLHRSERFGESLGGCPSTPPWVLEKLLDKALASAGYSSGVLAAIAHNPALSASLMERLAAAAERHRHYLATVGTSGPLLRRLMSDSSPRVRELARQRAPKPLRGWAYLLRRAELLARGHGEQARGGRGKLARKELSVKDQRALCEGGVWARVVLARQARVAPEIACLLAADTAPQVRRTVAAARWLDDGVISALMSGEDEATSLRLVGRPRLSIALAEALARSGFLGVRRRLVLRPDLPLAALLLLEGDAALGLELKARGVEPRRG